MKLAKVKLTSVSELIQGRNHGFPKLERELAEEYEERTWREKAHYDTTDAATAKLIIPPFAIKNCLSDAAKFMSIGVPGKGKATYTKHFDAGVLVFEPVETGILKSAIVQKRLFVPASGISGDGRRVWKSFPSVPSWEGIANIYVTDEIITKDVLQTHLNAAGRFIGLGSFRIRNKGICGGFTAEILEFDNAEF